MPHANFGLRTREVTLADAVEVARLTEELGYHVSSDAMRQRLEPFKASADRVVYGACLAGELVGWIEVILTNHLAAEPRAEIAGLVVSSGLRSRGIGRLLVARAEQWAMEKGVKIVLVRSREARQSAHRFYLREGFEKTKTSFVFTKKVG